MSDISAALQSAIATALRASPDVMAAFGVWPIQIFDIPPINAKPPYLTIGPAAVSELPADGFDLSEMDFPVHVWSLTSPPGHAEAQGFAAAVRSVLPGVEVTAGGLVYAVTLQRTTYLTDPSDGRTAHAIIACSFTTAPA